MTGITKSINKKYSKKIPLFKLLMSEHVKYGKSIISFLDFLEKHKTSWEYKENEFSFKDDKLSKEYDTIMNKVLIHEEKVQKFAKEVTEAM